MKRTLIRYKARPEKAQENQRLIERVFRELQEKSPSGVRYLALKLDDGTFVHFKVDEGEGMDPIHELEAFQSFRSAIKDRCLEPPQASDATIVGNYRMLND